MVSKWVQVCDLEHDDEEDVPATESVTFQADGKTFALDLCNSHLIQWQAFEQQQQKWQRAARIDQNTSRPASPARGRVSDTAEHRKENTAIREWAKTQPDIDLGERGRIPDWIRQRYRDAMGAQARGRWDESGVPEQQPVPVGAASG